MFDVNGWEFLLLLVVGIVVLGPARLPEYAAKLAQMVKQVRSMATNAQVSLRDQLGPEFADVDWKQYDPRQYDPRRIVREALMEPLDDDDDAQQDKPVSGVMSVPSQPVYDPAKPVPWDVDAT
ncbi:twin-arginine translocase TatA/TatE family subunit [Dermatophilaceae bacterium Soc4.6]